LFRPKLNIIISKPLFWISRLRREIFSSYRFEFCQRQNSKR
jgi:hypothetical protein